MYDLLITNGTLVEAHGTHKATLAIKNGRIAAILAPDEQAEATRTIDATGRCILPGLIDAHMHVQAPFQGVTAQLTFFQQSVAAAFGGVTTFMDYTNTWKGQSVVSALHARKAEMAESAIDFGVHGKFVEANAAVLDEIPALVAEGCPTFKLFMTYRREGVMADDDTLVNVFAKAAASGGMPLIHAESNALAEYHTDALIAAGQTRWSDFARAKPEACEIEAFARAVHLAEAVGAPLLIVHTTSAACLDIARAAQERGAPVYVETCPHYLTLFKELYADAETGHLAICSPPLRGPEHVEPLWEAMRRRVVAVTGSDDCTFTRAEKERFLTRNADGTWAQDFTKVVNGLSGLETRFAVLMTEGVAKGRISLPDFVALTSTNAARLFGCYPQKGTLAPGADADLVIIDPAAEWTIRQADLHNGADFSLFEGYKAKGRVLTTLSRGSVIMDNQTFTGARGHGRYVSRVLDPSVTRAHNALS